MPVRCGAFLSRKNSKELERIHMQFCKRVLGVKLSTSNAGIYGELGRYPLYVARYTRIVKYWFKILYSDNITLRTIYDISVKDCENGLCNWVKNRKTILEQYGLGYIWLNPYSIEPNIFVAIFKQRLIDEFTQKWISDMANNSVLDLYKYVKTEFGYANYLDHVRNKSLRHEITKIRVSSHTLRIQTGRYGRNRLERNERLCMYCDSRLIDDEYNFICECPTLDYIRAKYIKDYYRTRPNAYKLCQLLSTQNKVDINNLGKFIKDAFLIRKRLDG